MYNNSGTYAVTASKIIACDVRNMFIMLHVQLFYHFLVLFISLSGIFILSSTVHAQSYNFAALATPVEKDEEKFVEYVDPRPDVSGSPLVGIRLGEINGKINVDNVYIVIPLHKKELSICISNTTKDGRYFSENLYAITYLEENASFARVRPFTVKESKNLKTYNAEDVAVLAFYEESGRCLTKDATYLPQIISSTKKPDNLKLQINSSARITKAFLQLNTNDEPVPIKGTCEAVCGNACLTFDTECTFSQLSVPKAGKTNLKLVFDDGFGEDVHEFMLLLPFSPSLR